MKKILSVLLIASLTCSIFAGCAKTAEAPKANESATADQTPADTKDAETPEASEVAATIGTADSPAPVAILMKDMPPTEEGIQLLVEKIEEGMAKQGQYVALEFLEQPSGSYVEAVPLAFRTGQLAPDLIYFQGDSDLAIAQEGLLEDLTPYIEGSTHVKSIMQSHSVERLANYPYLLWLAPARVPTPVIRKDHLEKLTTSKALLEDPSIDNYYNFFKEIKDTGIADMAITTDGNMDAFDSVFNHAFGVETSFMQVDGKWVSSKVTSFEKEKLAFYAKLYKEGLLDNEYLTNKWDIKEQKFYENKAAVIAGNAGAVIQIYNDKMTLTQGEAAELVVLPPAKGVGQAYISIDNTKESRGIAIAADSENKDAAFAVLEYMASPEGRMLDKIGIEGVHYNITDGKIVLTDRFTEWWARFWDDFDSFKPGMSFDGKEPFSAPALDSLAKAAEFYYPDKKFLTPENLMPQWDAMSVLYKEYAADIIRGVKPIEAFDEFVVKWNEAGGIEINAYAEEQFK